MVDLNEKTMKLNKFVGSKLPLPTTIFLLSSLLQFHPDNSNSFLVSNKFLMLLLRILKFIFL